MELLKGAKHLQSNSDCMNKIKERSAVVKPNVAIELGALFIINCSRHISENEEL